MWLEEPHNIEALVVPVERSMIIIPNLKFHEPRTFVYSMTLARMLAPRAVIMKQYESSLPKGGDTECIICFNDENSQEMLPLPCGHRFHPKCIQRWFRTQSYSALASCPMCRKSSK